MLLSELASGLAIRPAFIVVSRRSLAPGAEEFLEGNGGLRAQILSDGVIAVGDAQLVLAEARLIEI